MQDSEERWFPTRIAGFLVLALLLYGALFLWSDRILLAHGDRNPFFRIGQSPARTGWIVLGASHALPLGFEGVPDMVRDATGEDTLTLAVAGGGPAVMRLVAERYFADREADGVLIVLDAFAFADARWNEDRIDDGDLLPKIPADRRTLAVFKDSMTRGLPAGTFLAYATGFARINDRTRFRIDRWDAASRFDSTARPSDAAETERIAYLYPGSPSQEAMDKGLADVEALVGLARSRGTKVVLVYPPLPERFRKRLPELPALGARLEATVRRLNVPLHDHRGLLPESKYYFDTDHLNRSGIDLWLERGLGDILRRVE